MRRLHISAVYRWIQRGVRGVRLETIRIGGTTYTSLVALQRLADRQSQPVATDPVTPTAVVRRRQREIDAAARQVEEILGRRAGGGG